MVYSRGQEQFALWLWMTVMATVGVLAVWQTIGAVRDIFRFGFSTWTVSFFLLVAGLALIGLSNVIVTLLFMLFPSRFGRSPRWFLVVLGIGVVMTILGIVGM